MDFVGVFLDHSFCKQVFACSSHKCTFNRFLGCCLVTFSESCWWDTYLLLSKAPSALIFVLRFFPNQHQFLLYTSTAASWHITYNAMFTWKVNDLNSRSKNFLGLWPAVLLGEFLPVGEQRNKASVTVQRTFWANKGPKSPDSRFWQEVPTCHQNSACWIPNFFYFPLWLIPTELDLCELLK
jgi:hypothetical protein